MELSPGVPTGNPASMPALRIALLACAVVGVLVRPHRAPVWLVPVAAVAVGLATTATKPADAVDAVDPLVSPLAFLVAAVPLALLLDELGFFAAVAAKIGATRHLHVWMWCFAAAVTTLFNLDAAVVLLTPLYVRIARRHGLDPVAAAFPPVLLASLASSALPVSNLTNLLVAEHDDLHAADFLLHLGPASLAAIVTGYFAYRRSFSLGDRHEPFHDPVDERALRRGAPVVAFVLLGFTAGDAAGVPAWVVAVLAVAALVLMTRSVPWRHLPLSAVVLAGSLGVLAASAAPHLGLEQALAGSGATVELRVLALAVLGSNAVNNLPALLVGLPALGVDPGPRMWALLAGVNMGPILVVTGSLAGLLWLDTARRLGVQVDARRYSAVGVRVGVPALAAATVVLLATNALAS
jgi:arsenical pump membrane protein